MAVTPRKYHTLGNELPIVRASAVQGLPSRTAQQTKLAGPSKSGKWWRMPHPWSTCRPAGRKALMIIFSGSWAGAPPSIKFESA